MSWLNNDYPETWDTIRKLVYKRDNWTCQKCGARNIKLHAHHIVPVSQGGSNEFQNLITLCENCHINEHPLWGYHKLRNFINTIIWIVILIAIILGLLR
jgi:5-methylcytosine-specific restriction endonuclease McrA